MKKMTLLVCAVVAMGALSGCCCMKSEKCDKTKACPAKTECAKDKAACGQKADAPKGAACSSTQAK